MSGAQTGERGGYRAGIVAVTITSVLWGTTGTAATFAPGVGPLTIGAAALGIGGLLQALIAIRQLRAEASTLRAHARTIAIGAIAVAVYPLAFYSSMHLAGVAIGSVVSLASAPLFSGLFERVLEGRRLGGCWIASVLTGTVGSALLCRSRLGESDASAGEVLLGAALGLVAGATYALYSRAAQRLMAGGASRSAAMGSVFGLGGLLLMPVLLATGAPIIAAPQSFAVAAYLALIPMFLGYVLFGYGLARVPASTATTVTLSEPAVAAVLAVLVVGERLDAQGWIGLALLAAVLVLLAFAPTAAPNPRVTPTRRSMRRSSEPAR